MFRDDLSVPSLLYSWSLRKVPKGCPEKKVRNYHSTLPNTPKSADIIYIVAEASNRTLFKRMTRVIDTDEAKHLVSCTDLSHQCSCGCVLSSYDLVLGICEVLPLWVTSFSLWNCWLKSSGILLFVNWETITDVSNDRNATSGFILWTQYEALKHLWLLATRKRLTSKKIRILGCFCDHIYRNGTGRITNI